MDDNFNRFKATYFIKLSRVETYDVDGFVVLTLLTEESIDFERDRIIRLFDGVEWHAGFGASQIKQQLYRLTGGRRYYPTSHLEAESRLFYILFEQLVVKLALVVVSIL